MANTPDSLLETDAQETQEWLESLHSVIKYAGIERAQFLLGALKQAAQLQGIDSTEEINTPYKNSLPLSTDNEFTGNEELERRVSSIIRWNALVMVLKAGKVAGELGGHISSYASAAFLYETGFNHFFHATSSQREGDLLFTQGHSSPGIYARAFLEGRLNEEQLCHFRQEIGGKGLSSYPHPYLMPNFWQFPTVSMGLGPIQAIYQARFLNYLHHRELTNTVGRKVWVFCGDGEMDEPESLGALAIASRESLDNLIFVINCNLQRLDGPVRGNGKIIQELERIFKGNGWNVIKVIWGREWDPLFAKDTQGLLQQRLMELVDGEYQTLNGKDGAYIREHLFGKSEALKALVSELSDDQLGQLVYGGHDLRKIFAAYKAATSHKGQPTVILAKTVKGYGFADAAAGQNIAHNLKKLTGEQLEAFRTRFQLGISKEEAEHLNFYHPGLKSPEIQYLQQQRQQLGGYLPARRINADESLTIPSLALFDSQLKGSEGREISTTMAYVRILNHLLKDKTLGNRIVPIVPDESRTFGMEGLFRQIGIYSPLGQLYDPIDAGQVMYYREDKKGQLLEEGINEAGGFCSWMAAGTSYSVNNLTMIPFYIYYSMFGFQRVGDLVWAAGDLKARGFILGATAGRTTLAGEGLQHQDGHNLLFFSTVPNCVAYDPAFNYELAVLIHNGLERMVQRQENVFFYLTLMNENYEHPALPAHAVEGIIKGMYLWEESEDVPLKVQLLGSGTILREVIAAAALLKKDFDVNADIWSVTSFSELRKEAIDCERYCMLHPSEEAKISYVTNCLKSRQGPVIAATDYIRLNADQIRAFVPGTYAVLGTDGFGRSDTRVHLREFFEVNRYYIALAALNALLKEGKIERENIERAIQLYQINPEKLNPIHA